MELLTIYLNIIVYVGSWFIWLHDAAEECLENPMSAASSDINICILPLGLFVLALVTYFYLGSIDSLKYASSRTYYKILQSVSARISGVLHYLTTPTNPENTIDYWKKNFLSGKHAKKRIIAEKNNAVHDSQETSRMNDCLKWHVEGLQEDMINAGAYYLPKACFTIHPTSVSKRDLSVACCSHEAMKKAQAAQLKTEHNAQEASKAVENEKNKRVELTARAERTEKVNKYLRDENEKKVKDLTKRNKKLAEETRDVREENNTLKDIVRDYRKKTGVLNDENGDLKKQMHRATGCKRRRGGCEGEGIERHQVG